MLIEINLLPQKEPRKFNLIIFIILISLIVMISSFYIWQIQSTKNNVKEVDRQIETIKEISAKEAENAQQDQSIMSVSVLKNAVEWANTYPIQTIPVMQHLTALLPERGFIQSFGYTETGTVTISVQFDNPREAAYFLDSLNKSDWIGKVSLSSLNAQAIVDPSANATQSTTTTTTTTTTTESVNSTQPNDAVSDQNNMPAAEQASEPNTNTVTAPSTTSGTVTSVEEKYLPRYIGQYEISFSKNAIKKVLNKGKTDGEEVSAS
jgi:preprotein translocase subunit YajC